MHYGSPHMALWINCSWCFFNLALVGPIVGQLLGKGVIEKWGTKVKNTEGISSFNKVWIKYLL